jgi:adenosylcobinamide-GDP ribazoletransferase
MRSLLVALQFLTIVPVRVSGEITPRTMGRAMAWFPVVGLMLGACLAAADLAFRAVFPPAVSAALLLGTWAALTGGLHLDGFLDCCDGLLAAKPPEQRLEIMRDPRVGAFAVVGAVCLLLVKFAALLELTPASRPAALLVIPALSRAAMVFSARAYPYARPGPGLGQVFREGLTWRHVAIAGLVAALSAGGSLGLAGLALVVVVWLLTVGIAWLVRRRIPGLTGDVYGAINELAEAGALLFLLILWRLG